MELKYHKTLTQEKWSQYSFSRQILMIANELKRVGNWLEKDDRDEARLCYDRAFELLFLTVSLVKESNKLRELLRFKEACAGFYASNFPTIKRNSALLEVLLTLDKDSFVLLHPAGNA